MAVVRAEIDLPEIRTKAGERHALQDRVNQALYADPSLLMAVDATGFTGLLPSNMGIIYAFLKPGEQRPPIDAMAGEMMGRLGAIPGVFPLLRPFPVLQISTGATNQNQGQYAFAISGTDAGQVYQASDTLMGKLRAFPGFASLSSDAFRRTPRLEIDVLREQAKAYGVSEARILALLRNAYSQSYLYLINRNNGLIIQSCWLPFRDGGVGNGTLSTMRLPSAVDPFGGSGNYLLTDAGEPDTIPNSVAVIDQAACHNGQQATSLGELPKAHGIDGLDYEWNGSTSNDVFVGFYNDGGPVPAFGLHFVGLNAGSLIEDISMCGYQATFGGSGNDMCPYP